METTELAERPAFLWPLSRPPEHIQGSLEELACFVESSLIDVQGGEVAKTAPAKLGVGLRPHASREPSRWALVDLAVFLPVLGLDFP